MEHLLAAAINTLSKPLSGPPLTPEILVVQSKGMQRWLSMELAKNFGVWTNAKYPFPNRFVNEISSSILPESVLSGGFTPKVMRWKVMELIPGLVHLPQFAEIRNYLSTDAGESKLYQLSGKISDLFDQYTLYRGDMIDSWEKGGGEGWQPILWRAVVSETPGLHARAMQKELIRVLNKLKDPDGLLPERLTVFGISSLPRFHMDILAAISKFTEVNLFVLSPCELYWGDILPGKIFSRQQRESMESLEQWNPLLASLGRLGKDYSNLILDYEYLHGGGRDLYSPADGGSALADLQNDLLYLRGDNTKLPSALPDNDRSISIHSCHSPLREIEVLHDHILLMFEALPGLKPGDILVMAPDIEIYAPYISAVFDSDGAEQGKIPYAIADRSVLSDNRFTDGFISILNLSGSRFDAPAIMDLLEMEPVQSRFNIKKHEMESIRLWIEETRIRWGMDGTERTQFGVPAYEDQTWLAGINRLLLGVAMPEDDGFMFADILPYDAMEGENIRTLGKFTAFVKTLHETTRDLNKYRNIESWTATLKDIVNRFFIEDDGSIGQLQVIFEAIDELSGQGELSGFKGEISLSNIISWLIDNLSTRQRGVGFMTGGTTFCAMLPMRSIPFRVIAMLGMNDGDFPRQSRPVGFDLIARNPVPGDRSLRNEDRYLFLEALLSARDRLYISYVGQGIFDNAAIPPSVLVSELLDYMGSRYHLDGTGAVNRFVTYHRLQPFSPAYFIANSSLFTYSQENFNALTALENRPENVPAFLPQPLPSPPEEMLEISLSSLLAFYRNPCRFLLANRLGIRPDEIPPPPESREAFSISPLDRYFLKDEIIRRTIANNHPEKLLAITRAKGILPPASQGDRTFKKSERDIQPLVTRISDAWSKGAPLPSLEIDITIGKFRLKGTLDNIRSDNMLRFRPSAFNGQDAIRLWIEHLLLNYSLSGPYPATTLMLTEDRTIRLEPVEDPVETLHELFEFYWRGLQTHLRFFPKSSYAYAENENMGNAISVWKEGDYPEGDDPYYRIVFAERDALNHEFRDIAVRIFKPFLNGIGE